jgi:hypothetical protein
MADDLLEIEVFAHVLGSMDHCKHCQVFIDGTGIGETIHRADLNSYPPDWMDEWRQLSDLILQLTEQFAGQLVVKITDAQSPQGLWAAIRRGVRQYPTFMIGRERVTGLDRDEVTKFISRHLPAG